MARVKNKNTEPEIIVRRVLHRLGYRFRLHRRDLPGNPDIVLTKYHTVIFVHGCFWHGHDCPRGKRPSTNKAFWNQKLDKNIERDKTNQQKLRDLGWNVGIVWGCEVKNSKNLEQKLIELMQLTNTIPE